MLKLHLLFEVKYFVNIVSDLTLVNMSALPSDDKKTDVNVPLAEYGTDINQRIEILTNAIQKTKEVIWQQNQKALALQSKVKCLQMIQKLQQGKITYVEQGAESFLQEYGIQKVRLWEPGFETMIVVNLE